MTTQGGESVRGAGARSAHLIESMDWRRTPLGPLEGWPEALLWYVRLALGHPLPAAVCWGSRLITLHNDAYRHLLGEEGEALGRPFLEVWPEAGDAFPRALERARAGHPAVRRNVPVSVRRSGEREEVRLDYSLSPLWDDSGAVAGVFHTVVESPRSGAGDAADPSGDEDAALRAAEDQFEAMFEAATVGMAQTDPEARRFLKVNSAFCDITGYSEAELLQLTVDELNHPEDREADRGKYDRLVEGGTGYASEKRYVRKDGSVVWVRVVGGIIRDRQGRPLRAFAVVEDISERKRAQQELSESEVRYRELSRTLEERVAARTAELEGEKRRLQALAEELASAERRERKRLAALLHDELQQLLVSAEIELNLASAEAHVAELREGIHRALMRLGEASAATRQLTRELRPHSLYEVGLVSSLQELASEFLRRHRLHVRFDAPENTLEASVGEDLKAFVFDAARELLFNVVKHARVDEATLSVREEERRIRLVVEDSGRGFDPEWPDQEEEGLGLFSLRERLAALGGTMRVRTAEGEGARVELELPTPEASGG